MSENLKLGSIITTEQQRDAVHIAVCPVVSHWTELEPGAHVAMSPDGAIMPTSEHPDPIGVVDPYLREPVKAGQRFWLFLYPGSITSLRHEWSHPGLRDLGKDERAKAASVDASRLWLEGLAKQSGTDLDTLLHAALQDDSYSLSETDADDLNSKFESNEVLCETFWGHVETYTGRPAPKHVRKYTHFSCSC